MDCFGFVDGLVHISTVVNGYMQVSSIRFWLGDFSMIFWNDGKKTLLYFSYRKKVRDHP